ncbi:hypothetical protein E4U21_000070 [Claviceps maximensis]|nr:hypothetical protein E4U21_000070 [Claviceps maximensis]
MPSRWSTTRLLFIALLHPHPVLPVVASCPSPCPSPCPCPSFPPPLIPIIVHTWSGPFTAAASAAATVLRRPHASVLDAIEAGGSACEHSQCDGTVGYGGSPDEDCETTLDALIMDGHTLDVGAVGALRRVRHAISVARHVLEHTEHSLLVGELATRFALERGFAVGNLSTEASAASCLEWKSKGCQPNARRAGPDVVPDPGRFCGPYHYRPHHHRPLPGDSPHAATITTASRKNKHAADTMASGSNMHSHDTISLIALNATGHMAAGSTTNGRSHKIPGRVGDAPLPGSGAYVDSLVGGCGATGDGDILMRFLPCYQAVESMRSGMPPRAAAEDAIRRMLARYPDVRAGIVVLDKTGEHAAAASNWLFSYSFRRADMNETEVVAVKPLEADDDDIDADDAASWTDL